MRYKNIKRNQLLWDSLFCSIIILIMGAQVIFGILGIIYLPKLNILSKFWICVLNICLYGWTVGSSLCFLMFVLISVQLIKTDIKIIYNIEKKK